MSRPGRASGFWPGTRSSFRRVTKYRRIPGIGTIRRTYTIPELKYKDTSEVGTVIDESGNITLLNALQLGTAATSRVGMRINMRSVHLKYLITGPTYATLNGSFAQFAHTRVMIILDLQPNGATPALSDILEDTTAGLGIVSPIYLANGARFKVLYDKRHVVTPNNIVAANNVIQTTALMSIYDEIYLKLSHEVQYSDSNNGDITDIKTGALFLVTLTSNATAGQQPGITSYTRLRFHDN